MSRAYMIRCQGLGVLHDKVFPDPPTDAQLQAALQQELDRHGVTWDMDEVEDADGNKVQKIVGALPRERWVQVQATELVDGEEDSEEEKKYQLRRTTGTLTKEQLDKKFAETTFAPPGTMAGAVPQMVLGGTGRVINPGEKMTIGAGDVATVESVLGSLK